MVRGRAFSMSLCESFAWLDHDTLSWKTSQLSLTEDSTLFSKKWPKQGMMQNGHVFEHLMWVPATNATVGGSLPTPTRSDHLDRSYHYPACVGVTRGEKLSWALGKHFGHNDGAKGQPGVNRSILTGDPMYLNPSFVEEMMGYPAGYTDLKL